MARHLKNALGYMRRLEGLIEKMPALISDEMVKTVRAQLKTQKDPSGEAYERTKAGTRFDPNGTIQKSWVARPRAGVARAESTLPYTGYHEEPTSNRPARRMRPRPGELELWHERITARLRRQLLRVGRGRSRAKVEEAGDGNG